MRKLIATLTAGAMLWAVPGAGIANEKTVWEDPEGDAGINGEAIPGAEQGGFDLVKGTIAKKGQDLEFTVYHSAMPSSGSLPEGFRFLWHFSVDGEEYRFTAKSADIGKPDVVAGSGEERVGNVDTDGHFRLEQCVNEPLPAVLTLNNCNAVEYLEGTWDTDEAAFTIVLPMEAVSAKAGSVVFGGTSGASGSNCQICWVVHSAERSLTPATIIDSASMGANEYKVPGKKKKKKKKKGRK